METPVPAEQLAALTARVTALEQALGEAQGALRNFEVSLDRGAAMQAAISGTLVEVAVKQGGRTADMIDTEIIRTADWLLKNVLHRSPDELPERPAVSPAPLNSDVRALSDWVSFLSQCAFRNCAEITALKSFAIRTSANVEDRDSADVAAEFDSLVKQLVETASLKIGDRHPWLGELLGRAPWDKIPDSKLENLL